MLKRGLACVLVLCMLVVGVPAVIAAEETYIPIRTVVDLYNVRNDLTANYRLMNDIDLTEATAEGGDFDFMGNGWNPIGSNDVYGSDPFTGIFDGAGHSIIGMRIETKSFPSGAGKDLYFGLFSTVSGTVKNLTLTGGFMDIPTLSPNSSGGTLNAGMVAATLAVGTIENCHNYNTISIQPDNIVAKKPSFRIGGLCGQISTDSLVIHSSNKGNITSLLDVNEGGRSNDCGGVVGVNDGSVEKCFNSGNILAETITRGQYYYNGYQDNTGWCNAGGISGSGWLIQNCYNAGKISASSYYTSDTSNLYKYARGSQASGIASSGYGDIDQCYNSGLVTILRDSELGYAINKTGTATKCYYLKDSGLNSAGATELTEAQMKMESMFNGFDFENIWVLNPYAGHSYPQLQSNPQDLEEKVELVRIMALPNKLTYYTGDALIMDGCVFEAVYISGRTEMLAITPDMLSGFDPTTAGKQTVTLTYRGKSDTFEITVEERPAVTDVTLISPPDKTEFAIGSAFDMTGASLQIVYDNGTSEIKAVTSDMVSGGNINHLGDQELTITYEGWTFPIAVKVVSIKLEKVEWAIKPTKVNYIEGEELDTTGLTLTTHFNNGRVETVTNGFTTSGFASVAGTHTVTVNYSGFTLTFDVTVDHKWNTKYTIDIPATCTTAGSQSIHCTMCDATKNAIEIPAINHLWSVADHLDATCTSDGYTDYVCMNDNTHTRRDVEPSPGHVWDTDYMVDDPATCEKEGQKSIHCTGCDLTKDVTVIPMVDCQWKEVDRQEATCTQDGSVDYVCVYNPEHTKREALPAPGHEWSTEWSVDKEASCTEAGSKSHHCLHCEEKQDVTEIPKEDHEYGEWEVEVEATPEKEGIEVRKCLHCDAEEERAIPYISSYGDVNSDGEITVSDALLVLQAVTDKIILTSEQITASDVDGNKAVTVSDALLILQVVTGKLDIFPVEQ